MTKAVAYFLPQYHEIPENNEWWGAGFTEWTNLKKAVPLFKGHQIPAPLNDNYYNLLEKETVIWQTELMKEYEVHGLVYYHYWFLGRKILERPAENLLKWKDINQKFMFMWANHDWTRSWVGGREILLKQEYGNKFDWENHITYLLDFFHDERYIKVDNRPVFQIYVSELIPDYNAMIEFFDQVCKENGFNGIYIIQNVDNLEQISGDLLERRIDAFTLQEHTASLTHWRENKRGEVIYEKIKRLLRKDRTMNSVDYVILRNYASSYYSKLPKDLKVYLNVPTGWDNTPRYGSRGYIVRNSTPENFRIWLDLAVEHSNELNNEFIFISCWNEWCEGMCLEPTEQYKYKFLEVMKEIIKK
jgi:hypothetical protein